MRLSVIPPQFLNGLPNSIFFYDIQFDSSFYQKKTKPYSKLSIPRGYTHHQSLCKQFGIEPHTLLCMDSTLWRQQIIDTVSS
ncbi:hypothetical protein CROQUDRAFT_94166 [Cronartium quercuum f. sp. fusiforme G11]|uniref:Uncharacterized protein n=1 Tax=Cronartium quercuum f. sp. fusiforme G11 TaxID=708437 RepID=A0A9P6NJI7_9BASI|nr:hypothetical protein CROQUDRAFT_94166 [Cronartium quercuum f. sp. fusiforme G11]